MAYTKDQIETVLSQVASTINISDELFQSAEDEYHSLGAWIAKKVQEDEEDYDVHIYPQGSFALGTVIKPISEQDDYDLDLVCEITNGEGIQAVELKLQIVKPWITGYKEVDKIEEKRRCWHVEYKDVAHFHMDVIPALHIGDSDDTRIAITEKNEDADANTVQYNFIGSNPKGYVRWFFQYCRQKKNVRPFAGSTERASTEQEDLKQNKNKTTLQKAVQLLKRHRDIMFMDDETNSKPISILITTLAGQVYEGESTIYETIINFIDKVPSYLEKTKKDGFYYVENPSFKGENFADKWKEHPERQKAFFAWIDKLRNDFNYDLLRFYNRVDMGTHTKEVFGNAAGIAAYSTLGKLESTAVSNGDLKVNTSTGSLSKSGSIKVPVSHHYGEIH